MIRNWHIHLSAFLQRNARFILHTYSKQQSSAAMQTATESRKRCFFILVFFAICHGEQLAWAEECGKLLFSLIHEILACLGQACSPRWPVCGQYLIVYLRWALIDRRFYQSKCDPSGLLASLSQLTPFTFTLCSRATSAALLLLGGRFASYKSKQASLVCKCWLVWLWWTERGDLCAIREIIMVMAV